MGKVNKEALQAAHAAADEASEPALEAVRYVQGLLSRSEKAAKRSKESTDATLRAMAMLKDVSEISQSRPEEGPKLARITGHTLIYTHLALVLAQAQMAEHHAQEALAIRRQIPEAVREAEELECRYLQAKLHVTKVLLQCAVDLGEIGNIASAITRAENTVAQAHAARGWEYEGEDEEVTTEPVEIQRYRRDKRALKDAQRLTSQAATLDMDALALAVESGEWQATDGKLSPREEPINLEVEPEDRGEPAESTGPDPAGDVAHPSEESSAVSQPGEGDVPALREAEERNPPVPAAADDG